nr:type IV pilus modification protein PilV [uncultured Massilia sp.]
MGGGRFSGGGFTLVEVLVALFVAALGIAGACALQTLALRSQQEAARLADGVRLVSALAERMRANPPAMSRPDSSNPYSQFDYDAGAAAGASEPAAAAPCFGDGDCDAARLAAFDLAEVAQALAERFPGGRIRVCRDAGDASAWECSAESGAPLVAKLGWRESAAGGDVGAPRLQMALPGGAP